MNFVFFSAVLTFLLITFVPTQSFSFLNGLISKPFKSPDDITSGAKKYFANYMGTKLLRGGDRYKLLNAYSTQMTQDAWETKVTMDLLLQKVSTSDSPTYPLDYLQCNSVHVAIKENNNRNEYEIKSYDCPSLKDAEAIPNFLNKNIVAQSAYQYADLLSRDDTLVGNKYVVWRVLKVEDVSSIQIRDGKTHVKFLMKIQLIKKRHLLNYQLSIYECSNVAIKYIGKPEKFKSKYVTIKNVGRCTTITVPRF